MNKEKDEEWNWTFIAIITLTFGAVVAAFLTILIIAGFLWLDYKEDWRTSEAWRAKQVYDDKQAITRKCEASVLRQQGLMKIVEQSGKEIPSEYVKVEQCSSNNQTPEQSGH